MRTRTTNRPLGTDAAADFHNQQFDRAQQETQVFNSTTVKAHRTTRGIRLSAAPQRPAGIDALHVQDGRIEVDTSISYETWVVINIQTSHTLVTTGVIDRVSGSLVKASPGQYYSRQPVEAIGGDGKWNVPQNPPPDSSNYDSDSNFWIPLAGSAVECPYG